MTGRGRHSQKIAGQRKSHDLPAAVGQQLVKPHDAFEQVVERRRHLLLGEHRLAGREMDMAAEMLQFPQFGPVERRANAELAHRAFGAGMLFVCALQPEKPSCSLQDGPAQRPVCAPGLQRIYLSQSPRPRLMQIKATHSSAHILLSHAVIAMKDRSAMLRFALRQTLVTLMLLTPALAASPAATRERRMRQALARCHAIDRVSKSRLKTAPPFRTLHIRYPIETLAEALAEGISTGHAAMPEAELSPEQIHDLLILPENPRIDLRRPATAPARSSRSSPSRSGRMHH